MAKLKLKIQHFIYLSIATAITTIILKTITYFLTGSIGLMSDALESGVNLTAAIVALIIHNFSSKPADKKHNFGHGKAEYFSSIIEGLLILIAAGSIIYLAIPKLFAPRSLKNINIGFAISLIASGLNLITAKILIKQGKKHHSIILEADGKHLMADVWTSVGVLIGVVLVKITGFNLLDPILAILVAAHIIHEGLEIVARSIDGLLDSALNKKDLNKLKKILKSEIKDQNLDYHMLKTRQSGNKSFISFHLLVPKNWTIKKAHDKADQIEKIIDSLLQQKVITNIHLEPLGEKESYGHHS